MNLLIHEVLTTRKFAMDQMRRGLDCLEVLSQIQKYPDEMREYFVKPDETLKKTVRRKQACKFFIQSLDVLYDDKQFQIFK